MNVYSFVSRWNRFELLIATFRLQYCESLSGDKVDCLRVAICSMMVRCYWCISILIIIPTIRCCSLTGPLRGWSAVVLSDRRYPRFRKFDSTISIDVIKMKSYMDSLFDPTCVPVRVTLNKLIIYKLMFVNNDSKSKDTRTVIYKRADRGCRKGCNMQTRERSRSCRPHKPYTYTNCRPFKLCLKSQVFPIQRVDLRTERRSSHGEPCLRGYC